MAKSTDRFTYTDKDLPGITFNIKDNKSDFSANKTKEK